jgi:predicted O-methyltransferase YrrM
MTQLLIPEAINKYAEKYTSPESALMAALNRETYLKITMPQMLSGHLQGAILQMISHMLRPDKILEIGTFTGYSAICLAQGIQQGGMLHTIDINEELKDMVFSYICEAGLKDKITQHIGDATKIIPTIHDTFDLVFIDADKQNYSTYYDMVFNKLRHGGLIIADNVLYDGEVILPENEQSKNARAISSFNEKLRNDRRIEKVLLPVRDGLMIARKIAD